MKLGLIRDEVMMEEALKRPAPAQSESRREIVTFCFNTALPSRIISPSLFSSILRLQPFVSVNSLFSNPFGPLPPCLIFISWYRLFCFAVWHFPINSVEFEFTSCIPLNSLFYSPSCYISMKEEKTFLLLIDFLFSLFFINFCPNNTFVQQFFSLSSFPFFIIYISPIWYS